MSASETEYADPEASNRGRGQNLDAKDGSIVIAELDGDFIVTQFRLWKDGSAWLVPANPQFKHIKVTGREDFSIQGVVTGNIHKFVREPVRK